jgi:hypothetical protein
MIMTASAVRLAGISTAMVIGWAGAGLTVLWTPSAVSVPCAQAAGIDPTAIKATRIVRYTVAGRFHIIRLRGITVLVSWTIQLPGLVRDADRLGERALMLSF